mmetsp:Transcript_19762/g.37673  ORF Transcript_19762/g.37673 Transcript_19762/m.37673 type:complete len:257 (+) Transcript_19762:90-860(+)
MANVTVGVLALQGSFREHMTLLSRCDGVNVVEIRKPHQLDGVSGLVIPGGESTTMALVAERWGLIDALRAFAASGRPIWGTCAGLIFLAEEAEGMKEGGQVLLGGLHVKVCRNFFGAQINSFETTLPAADCLGSHDGQSPTFRAIFIRAPGILSVKEGVEVLAEYVVPEAERAAAGGVEKVAVAVREGVLMATSFHPELTEDIRWHQMFVRMCRDSAYQTNPEMAADKATIVIPQRPLDLPVYEQRHFNDPTLVIR